MNTKNFIGLLILLVAALIPASCGDEYIFATESDCNNCIFPEPIDGPLEIKLTVPKDNSKVVIKIFKGDFTEHLTIDDSQAFYVDTVISTPVRVDVPVNADYSAVAEYESNGKIIKVIDGSRLKLYSVKSTCNTDCWIYKGGTLDCQLKY